MTWPQTKLGDVCEVLRGTMITQAQARPGNIPVVAGGTAPTYFHDSPNRAAGTITISASGANAGYVNFWSQPIFASDCTTVRSDGVSADIRFMYHQLRFMQHVIDGLRAGAAQPHVYAKDIAQLIVAVPPLAEQRRISATLDMADALRTKRREALAQFERLARSMFLEMFGDPATNPKHFPRRKLGDIIKFEGGAQPPASTFSDSDGPDKIRLIQIRDFKSDRFKTFIPKSLAKRFLEADDVMIGRYGPPVFQILRGLAGSYNVALMKAVPREGLTKEFVFHLLKEERLQRFVVANSERTAGQSGVNLDLLEGYDAYLPPMDLQELFVRQMSSLNSMRTAMEAALADTEQLFSSLQQREFQGEA